MTKPKIIYQVDAFTSEPFKGNPAAVCILENEMPELWMQNVAAEMNLSETSFVLPGKKESIIRYFLGIVPAELYNTGHGWKLALLNDEKSVRSMKPDFGILKVSGYGDLIVTAPSDDKNFDFCVRCFAPAVGINEDPVTGSAHCALAPFWKEKTGKSEMVSHQVSERGGILKVDVIGDRVEVSGQAITILKGTLMV